MLGEKCDVIEAVIFDMDGLLVDSEPVWFEARRELLSRFGKHWTDADQEGLMGVSTAMWVAYVWEKLEGAMTRDEVLEHVVGIMAASYERGDVPLLPGAVDALDYCTARYRVGLASGSPKVLIDAALTGADWHRYFEVVLSSDECAHGKPAPDVYLEVLRRMQVSPAHAVVLEDSSAGVRAGKAANAKVVAIPRAYTAPDDPAIGLADARIDSLRSLPEVLGAM
jgi:HAD superfamily hydrolase (TIGR01509 family)